MTGILHVVATPIGNLGDISARAAVVLGRVGMIACEDTRRTARLLTHLGIQRPELVVVNEHTEAGAVRRVLDALADDVEVALVSDAGTPLVSDPGHVLVGAAIAAGVRVEAVPGASALLAALAVSGLPTDRFCFEGFLPRKAGARAERLSLLATEPRTAIVYESPRRVAATLRELVDHVGAERRVVVARELTKLHEEVWRGTAADAVEWIEGREPRGEFVVMVAGAPEGDGADDVALQARLTELLDGGASRRDAAATVAAELGVSRNRAYELAVGLPRP